MRSSAALGADTIRAATALAVARTFRIIGSELESRRSGGVDERGDDGFEEVGADLRAWRFPADQPRLHHRRLAHHGENAPARDELLEEALGQDRRRTGDDDCIVGVAAEPACPV